MSKVCVCVSVCVMSSSVKQCEASVYVCVLCAAVENNVVGNNPCVWCVCVQGGGSAGAGSPATMSGMWQCTLTSKGA